MLASYRDRYSGGTVDGTQDGSNDTAGSRVPRLVQCDDQSPSVSPAQTTEDGATATVASTG